MSENATFAAKVEKAGIIFIGPQPSVIDGLGDKIKARTLGELVRPRRKNETHKRMKP